MKIFITLFFITGFYSITLAQTKGAFQFGIGGGYNLAKVTDNQSNLVSTSVTGFNAFFSAEYFFSDRLSIRGKVIYDQKGWGSGYFYGPNGQQIDDVDVSLNYITVPIMAAYHFGKNRNWYANLGPYAGHLINVSQTNYSGNLKPLFYNADYGAAIGAGLKIPVTAKLKLFVEYDGQFGASNIFKRITDNSSIKGTRQSLNVGLNF